MEPTDIAWVAGVFEGEGSIVPSNRGVFLQVFMTDEDIIRRLHTTTGAGTVQGPYSYDSRPSRQPIWKWLVVQKREVTRLLLAMAPLLGERRRARIMEVVHDLPYKRGTPHCANGHNNWRKDTRNKRYCRTCASDRQRERRALEGVS